MHVSSVQRRVVIRLSDTERRYNRVTGSCAYFAWGTVRGRGGGGGGPITAATDVPGGYQFWRGAPPRGLARRGSCENVFRSYARAIGQLHSF